jgi:hypothetical protein
LGCPFTREEENNGVIEKIIVYVALKRWKNWTQINVAVLDGILRKGITFERRK